MKKRNKKKIALIVVLFLLLITTGCTKTLTDSNKKAVQNKETGQTLTENILCRPSSKNTKTIELYEKNKVDLKKLPECKDFKITSGSYEGIWTTIFVKPLAFILIKMGELVGNYGLSVIIISLLIRLATFPITRKTAMQSELMRKAQPEINKLQKKYANKKDQESMMKQNQEMMAIYKKYHINPLSGCLFAMLQLPIFIAFFEAIQRVPVIFEENFLGLQLGTTPTVGFGQSVFYAYIILMLLIAGTTFFSLKMNSTGNMEESSMKMMPIMMTVMIIITALFMPTGLGIYWVTSNLFTIVQNKLVKRSKEVNGKA